METNNNYRNIKKAIEKQINHGRYKSDAIYGYSNSTKINYKVLETIEMNVQKKFIMRNFN